MFSNWSNKPPRSSEKLWAFEQSIQPLYRCVRCQRRGSETRFSTRRRPSVHSENDRLRHIPHKTGRLETETYSAGPNRELRGIVAQAQSNPRDRHFRSNLGEVGPKDEFRPPWRPMAFEPILIIVTSKVPHVCYGTGRANHRSPVLI
jgi:hypothetical protein